LLASHQVSGVFPSFSSRWGAAGYRLVSTYRTRGESD
jgi:hypothetical protein